MIDVVALGELLIDLTPAGLSPQGVPLYACNAGGAPANVLTMLSILGKKTAFIGKVGRDGFGKFLKGTMKGNGINLDNLIEGHNEPTTLAVVHLDEAGDRSFGFYREKSADVMLRKDEISQQLLSECRIFHFGSVSMTEQPAREATLYAVKEARRMGKVLSYDPNYRPALWNDAQEAVKVMRSGLQYADIVKVSDDEVKLLTGEEDFQQAAEKLVREGAKIALVTAGSQGTWYATSSGCHGHVPSFLVHTVDTTGAGDTFLGAFLSKVLDLTVPMELLSDSLLNKMVTFANAAGALCTTGIGAIPSMPKRQEIEDLIKNG